MNETKPVTELLLAWRSGDRGALDRLVPLVQEELHRLAGKYMRGERQNHTLQATALVNEAYLRLVDSGVEWQNRAHFFAVAATVMRRILVDHARANGRRKRSAEKISLEESVIVAPDRSPELLALDDALEALAGNDKRSAKAVELHYFGGLTYAEISETLGISEATVDRDLRFAKSWLYREMNHEA